MTARLLLVCIVLFGLDGTAAGQVVLQELGSLETPPPRSWGPWGSHSLVVTDTDVRRVNWSQMPGERDGVFVDLPVPPSSLEAWGDSVLVHLSSGDGRLFDRLALDPTEWADVPSNWHLANTEINGEQYRIFVDPQFYLAVLTAPGPGGVVSLLDFAGTIVEATHWSWDGDRAVLSDANGVHKVDLSLPASPTFTGFIAPPVAGWTATGLAVHDRVAFVDWGDRIASYDLSTAGPPPLLDEVFSTDNNFVVGGRWLVSWNGDLPRVLSVYDTADPSHITLRGTITTNVSLVEARVQVAGSRVEVMHELGLEAHDIPPGSVPIAARGFAWSVLEGWPLAMAGNTAWLQGVGSRFVIDLSRMAVPRVQARATSTASASLQVVGDVLYHDPGSSFGVGIESLADPEDPVVLTLLDPVPDLAGVDVVGHLLAAADADGLVLYDVSDPAEPVRRGHLELAGAPERVALVGDTAVVTAVREIEPDLAHVVDISDREAPQLVASFELDPNHDSEDGLRVGPLSSRGNSVHVMVAVTHSVTGDHDAITATVDLTDPQTPQLTYSERDTPFWCYDRNEDGGGDPLHPTDDLPVTISDLHISFRADTVSVYADSGDPDTLVPVTSWLAPGAIATIAAAGNTLLVLTEHRLDRLTLSDFDIVAVPDAVSAAGVSAVPNPFNPQTAITFEMVRAGAADVSIFDVRGQQVGHLHADLPAGPASLTWRGTDQAGRALPSGTYLLLVRTPHGRHAGRCQLVR